MTDAADHQGLADRIKAEMTSDHSDALERNLEEAKRFVRLTNTGKVDVLVKEQVNNELKVALYLVGKLYAKTAELATTSGVGNEELSNELGLPMGSVLPALMSLRNKHIAQRIREGGSVQHAIYARCVERILREAQSATAQAKKE